MRKYEGNATVEMSESTFRKLIPKKYKKPHRKTDMCHICAELPRLERQLKAEQDLPKPGTLSEDEISELLEPGQTPQDIRYQNAEKIQDLNLKIITIKKHREFKDEQRQQFKNDKLQLAEGDALLVMDFKENIRLGSGPIQLGHDWYGSPLRAVFSIVVWFVKDGKLTRQDIVFVSECLNKDTQFVTDCLDKLREMEFFKELELSSVKLWMDNCGSHFKTKEFMYYLACWSTEEEDICEVRNQS